MKYTISARWLANPNYACNYLLQIFGVHANNLFIIKVKISHTHYMVDIWVAPIISNIFWTCSPISSKHMSISYPFLYPQITTYLSNIGVQIIGVFDLGAYAIMLYWVQSFLFLVCFVCLNVSHVENIGQVIPNSVHKSNINLYHYKGQATVFGRVLKISFFLAGQLPLPKYSSPKKFVGGNLTPCIKFWTRRSALKWMQI